MRQRNGSRIGWGSLLAVAVCAAVSCKFETTAVPATQLVVDVDAESRVRARVDELKLLIEGANHRDNLADRTMKFEQSLRPGSADPEAPVWPVRLVLTPQAGDARRVFELSATAFDTSASQVAQARVITGYVAHQIKYVKLVLEDDCIGITCGELETCKVGGCTDAFIEPKDLPLLPDVMPDSGVIDGGDANVPDAGKDAGPDGGPEGGMDSGVDSGPAEDPCTRVDHGGCDPLVVCQTIDGVPTCGQCPNGFVDVNGNGSRCEDIDECKMPDKGGCDADHGRCTNTPGGHDCSCEAGYHGDGRVCSQNVPCGDDPNVCDVLATCQEIQGKKVCQCKIGYEGDGGHCTNIDECTRNLDDCPVHATCADTEGSFTCTCDAGYEKPSSGANQCNDIDECTKNVDNCDDMPNACRNTDGSFMCQCPAGYSGTGVGDTCVDIDECTMGTDNCDNNPNACVNDVGGFHCMCPAGYSGTGIGNTCVDIDQCMTNMDDCADAPATCVNDTGSPGYHCLCPASGYTGAGTMASPCVDINECTSTTNPHTCSANATCTNTPAGSYTCTCNTGWMPSGVNPGHGVGGCANINECTSTTSPHDCNANATCMDTQGSFTCTCNAGYTPAGANPGHGTGGCTEVNECTVPSHDCNANATCTNVPAGSFTCTCNMGYTPGGANPGHGAGGCTDTDECMTNMDDCNANAACTNTPAGSYTCTCGAGYTTQNNGRGASGCVDTNGCTGSPCMNGGTCNDVAAPGTGHTCACACGFTGMNCETAPTTVNSGLTVGTGANPTVGLGPDTAYFVQVSLAQAGKLTGLGAGNLTGSGTVRMALYDNGAGAPGTRLAAVGPSAIAGTYSVSGCMNLAAGTYWVGILGSSSLSIGQDEGTPVTRYRQDGPGADLGMTTGTVATDAGASNLALYMITAQ